MLYSRFIRNFCYSFDTLPGLIWNIVALVVASISDSLLFKPRYLTREKQHLTSCTQHSIYKWYFVTKIVLTYCEKKISCDRENLLKFKAEGQEYAKVMRSLEQFIQTVKDQKKLW